MTSKIIARVMLTIGFLAASISYSAWTAQRTILDPTATRGASQALLQTPAVQTMLAREIRTALQPALGPAATTPKFAAAIDAAVADPKFVGAFEDAIVSIHKGVLSDGNGRVTLDTQAVTAAINRAIADVDPKLVPKVKKVRAVKVPMGSAELPHVGDARQKARVIGNAALAIALLLVGGGLLLVHDRKSFRRVGRRVAVLAIGPALVFALMPRFLESTHKPQLAVSAAMLHSYGHRVLFSAAILAIVGMSTWLIAIAMPKRHRDDETGATAPQHSVPGRAPDVRLASPAVTAPVPAPVREGLYL